MVVLRQRLNGVVILRQVPNMPPSTAVIEIEGMHCAACVRRVTAAIGKLPGVQIESVEIGSARVRFDPSTASPDSIAKAVDGIGFTAKPAA